MKLKDLLKNLDELLKVFLKVTSYKKYDNICHINKFDVKSKQRRESLY